MYKISCNALSGQNCDYEATGLTKDEARDNILDHGLDQHKEMIDSMNDEDKEKLTNKIEAMLDEQS